MLATNNWKMTFKNTIHNGIKNVKYLEINLTKDTQNNYT